MQQPEAQPEEPRLHCGYQPQQLRQAVYGANPHCERGSAQPPPFGRHQEPGQGPDDRKLY